MKMQESAFLAFYQYWRQERYKKACARHEKSSKTPKNLLAGQKSLLDVSKQKNLRIKRLLKKVTTLKMLLFSMTVVRRVVEMIVLAVTQEVVKVIAKTESDPVLSPCKTTRHL